MYTLALCALFSKLTTKIPKMTQEMEVKAIHSKVSKDKGKTKMNLAYSKKNLADEKLRAAAATKAEKEKLVEIARANKVAAIEGLLFHFLMVPFLYCLSLDLNFNC